MKKSLATILLLFVACLFSFSTENNQIAFPTFSLLKMDSLTYLTNKDLAENKNTVFINFSPTCEHCQNTIQSILDNMSKFAETQFMLTSFESFSSIRQFYFDHGLNSFTNVFIGQEIDYALTKQIQYSSFPCLILFDRNKQFIKKIDEETNAKTVLKALKINGKP